MEHYFKQGTSEPLDVQMTLTPQPASTSGITLALELFDVRGRALTTGDLPTVDWLAEEDAPDGVTWNPWMVRLTGLQHLTPGSYPFRVRLTDAEGITAYNPSGQYPARLICVTP